LTCGAIVGLSVAALGIGAAHGQMKRHFGKMLADETRAEKYTLKKSRRHSNNCPPPTCQFLLFAVLILMARSSLKRRTRNQMVSTKHFRIKIIIGFN
jgi:hypothetical protein